jgi:hypothetical protein
VAVCSYEGVTVRMTPDQATAAGSRAGLDEAVDGIPDNRGVGRQEAPEAASYVNGVGILFLALTMQPAGGPSHSVELGGCGVEQHP